LFFNPSSIVLVIEHGTRIEQAIRRVAVHVRGVAVWLLFFGGATFILREGEPVFVPILASVLLAYALEPFVGLLTRLRLPRALAVVVIYIIVTASAIGLARVAQAQANGFIDDLPATIAALKTTLTPRAQPGDQLGPLEHLQRAATEMQATIDAAAAPPAEGVRRVTPEKEHFDVRDYVLNAGLSAIAVTGRLSVIALLAFLLLLTGDFYKRKLVMLAGPGWETRKLTVDVIRTIDRQIERYLLVRVLISVIVATATGIGLWSVGVTHAAVWGVMAGVLNTLPFVGPSVAVALITLAAFLQFHEIEPTAAAGGVAAAVAVLEGNLVSPWLTGRAGELNTIAVFVSVLFWGWMWDVWGLLLAVPIMVAIKAAADHIDPLQPIGEILGR
jgi:predicted PurR-regulated permease PerM